MRPGLGELRELLWGRARGAVMGDDDGNGANVGGNRNGLADNKVLTWALTLMAALAWIYYAPFRVASRVRILTVCGVSLESLCSCAYLDKITGDAGGGDWAVSGAVHNDGNANGSQHAGDVSEGRDAALALIGEGDAFVIRLVPTSQRCLPQYPFRPPFTRTREEA